MQKPQDNDTMPLGNGFNFTPIHEGVRCRMRIEDAPARAMAKRGLRDMGALGTVRDLDTGKLYTVYALPCGLPNCNCDAEIVEL